MIALRDYQHRAIDAVRAEYANGVRRALLVAPTGFGKTAVASELIRRSVAKGRRVLFLVHRREIVLDTARRLRAANVPASVLMAGEDFDPSAPVVVASVMSVVAREHHPAADFVIWDEAHHTAAKSYADIAAQYPDARHLGLTATPERADGVGLRDAFDALVVGATVSELQAEGWLAQCDVIAPPTKTTAIAMSPVEAFAKYSEGRAAVIFAASVAESKAYAREIGAIAGHIDGDTPAEERDAILARFAAGEIRALTNFGVLIEGWDAPRAKVCILARPVGSAGALIQMAGRVLRPFEDRRALIVDLAGAVRELGTPDEERTFTLDGIDRAPKKLRPRLSQCEVCGSTVLGSKRGEVCSRCGTAWPKQDPIRVRPAELSAVKPAPATADRATKRREYERLIEIARRRGHRLGWAAHMYRARFGVWPRGFRSSGS